MAVFTRGGRTIPQTTKLTGNLVVNSESALIESLSSFDERGYDMMKEFATAVYIFEADGIEEVAMEGLGDFINSAAKFFKDLLDRIIKFFKEIFMYLTSFIGSFEKFIKAHEEKLRNTGNIRLSSAYKFTLDKDLPVISILEGVVNEFNREIGKIDEVSLEDMQLRIQQYQGNNDADKLRGSIVGHSGALERDELSSHLFKLFRNEESEPTAIDFSQSDVNSIISEYKSTNKAFKDLKKKQGEIEKAVGGARKAFEKGMVTKYVENDKKIVVNKIEKDGKSYRHGEEVEVKDKAETLRVANLYYSFRFNQVKEISSTILTAISAKTKAYKDSLAQDEKIIRKAIFGGATDED